MPYTMEDFRHDYVKDHLKDLSPEERLTGLSSEDRLTGLSPEQRLKGLSLEERLKGLTAEEVAALFKRLQAGETPPASE